VCICLRLAFCVFSKFSLDYFVTSPVGAVAKYCDEYVCLSAKISAEPHARSLPNFLCVLPMSMARSSSDMFTIGRITYHREGVFFPIENMLWAGKGGWECTARAKKAIYDCLVLFAFVVLGLVCSVLCQETD